MRQGTRNHKRLVANELAVRSFEEISLILARRHGIRISSSRVYQIAAKAESKLAAALGADLDDLFGLSVEVDLPRHRKRARIP